MLYLKGFKECRVHDGAKPRRLQSYIRDIFTIIIIITSVDDDDDDDDGRSESLRAAETTNTFLCLPLWHFTFFYISNHK